MMDKDKLKILFSEKNFLSEKEKELLMAVYYFPNHSARASDIYILLGYTAYQPINSLIGKLGKKISIRMDIPLTERYDGTYRGWDVLFTGETIGKGGWLWKMKEEVISVLEEIELVEKTFFKIQEDSEENKIYIEGAYKTLLRNFYERNPLAREKCIKYYGYKCFICGFDFNEFYGALGKNFIEVHHLIPLSEIKEEYSVNPVKDLRPLCSNCHSMIHRKKDSFLTVEELKSIINSRDNIPAKKE